MHKTKLLIILSLAFLFSNLAVWSQNNNTNDVSIYFDDGGISESRNIIKLNVLSTVNGDVPFNYERILNDAFSIEVGIGLLLPYYYPEEPQLYYNKVNNTEPGLGYSLMVMPRFYYLHSAPEVFYTGVQWRRRSFYRGGENIIRNDITVNYGIQFVLGRRILLDGSIGVGFRFKKGMFSDWADDNIELSLPLASK